MSTNTRDTSADQEETPLDDLCRTIANNDEYSTDVRLLAEGILDAVESGELDATRQ